MVANRIVLAAVIHALIVAAAIIYSGEKIATMDRADDVGSAGARQPAKPLNQEPRTAPLSGGEVLEKIRQPDDSDHIYGSADAEVNFISYMDAECPFCMEYYRTVRKMVDQSGGAVSLIVRHFPLDSHPAAEQWARASECVAQQGGDELFFDFFDQIYAGQGPFNEDKARAFLDANDIAKTQYQKCMSSDAVAERVREDTEEGHSIGVQGTPAMVVYNTSNGKAIFKMGALPESQMERLINELK